MTTRRAGSTGETQRGLDRLTRARALESMSGLLGEQEAREVWESTCRREGVSPDGPLDLDEVERVAEALMDLSGPVALVGSSLSIRVRTYRMLDGASRLDAFLESSHDGEGEKA